MDTYNWVLTPGQAWRLYQGEHQYCLFCIGSERHERTTQNANVQTGSYLQSNMLIKTGCALRNDHTVFSTKEGEQEQRKKPQWQQQKRREQKQKRKRKTTKTHWWRINGLLEPKHCSKSYRSFWERGAGGKGGFNYCLLPYFSWYTSCCPIRKMLLLLMRQWRSH